MFRGIISLCLRPQKGKIGVSSLSRALNRVSDVADIKGCPNSLLERWIHTPVPSLLYQDIQSDKYSHMLLDECFHRVGPTEVTFSMRWPSSLAWANTKQLEERFYVHGPWFNGPINTNVPYTTMLGDFESVFTKYETEILTYWVDFNQPKSPNHAKQFILNQWVLPFGVKADVFLYYGLAFAASFPPNFGIPVGKKMLYNQVDACLRGTLGGLELFGELIGQPVHPYIVLLYDPMVDDVTSLNSPLVVQEIRIRFQRVARDPVAGWKLVSRSQNTVTSRCARWKLVLENKLYIYGGEYTAANSKLGIILPFVH